ncbi:MULTISPECIES: hypothetical protein [unclassified Halomonas]|uniref:hypothetical protein n=1 Tax=unclassified Halomonas TaxID=2609666 RepID=UPI0020769182|nr:MULTISPECIES: hypothetical protein [unclassified Halomonas]
MTALLYEKEASAMASYQDMQQAFKNQRDAQYSYFSDLKRILDVVVSGYADHVSGGAPLNEKPEVAYGYKGYDKFERSPQDKQASLVGDVMSASIGVKIKESKSSLSSAWVLVVISLKRVDGSYLASICPADRQDVDCVEARLRDASEVNDVYEAMTAVIMGVLDPSIYE